MKQVDIDENMISDINSKYYSCQEFQSLKIKRSFNIIHSNVNGLKKKLDDYNNFINNTNFDIDILCISETSQKEDLNFKNNVSIDGYDQMSSLGSKTARGGVAIYVNNKLNAFERHDLNSVNNSYEAIWIEIKQKSRNIICASVYRHPNSIDSDFCSYMT